MKIGIVILADTVSHEGFGRAVNGLETAKELKEAGDQVQIIFDGAGTHLVPEFDNPEHKYHALFQSVRDKITGACDYCAGAFGVKEKVQKTGIKLLDEFDQHPSLRKLLADGYQILTF